MLIGIVACPKSKKGMDAEPQFDGALPRSIGPVISDLDLLHGICPVPIYRFNSTGRRILSRSHIEVIIGSAYLSG
jgi:hypothetical protein